MPLNILSIKIFQAPENKRWKSGAVAEKLCYRESNNNRNRHSDFSVL